MTREAAVAILVAVAVLLLGLMAWGWWRRSRRDRALSAPTDVPVDAAATASFSGLYVATTRHDAPLDRLAIRHLAYRGRVRVDVTATGVILRITGEPDVFLGAPLLLEVGRATWTIDRVVERDGLVYLAWRVDDTTVADSYLRLQGTDPDALVAAVQEILPAPTTTGPDA
ncbi:hypothetical protein ACIGCK_07615 [Microbacterium sp. NPDC078428]|uniref:PH-like domain-containing protein n=1 Tax=Microbacterium sp. NPDC078428 TaxID=3364190 RepID=UPI0037C6766E